MDSVLLLRSMRTPPCFFDREGAVLLIPGDHQQATKRVGVELSTSHSVADRLSRAPLFSGGIGGCEKVGRVHRNEILAADKTTLSFGESKNYLLES